MGFGKFMRGVGRFFNKAGNVIGKGVGFVKDKLLPAVSQIPILGQAVPMILGSPLKGVAGAVASGLGGPLKNISGQGLLDVAGGVGKALQTITS
jgi:hypothetical protein